METGFWLGLLHGGKELIMETKEMKMERERERIGLFFGCRKSGRLVKGGKFCWTGLSISDLSCWQQEKVTSFFNLLTIFLLAIGLPYSGTVSFYTIWGLKLSKLWGISL